MKFALLKVSVLALMAGSTSYSQVQLFEQDLAGIHAYLAGAWNPKITQGGMGLEYNIEGRTSLGMKVLLPLADTLTARDITGKEVPGVDLKSYLVNPYVQFEFVEPGALTGFSFSLRGDFVWEDATDESNAVTFNRIQLGGGPIFAYRILMSDRMSMIPSAGYALSYMRYKSFAVTNLSTLSGKFDSDWKLWHDVSGSLPIVYKMTEFIALDFEPKITIKIGEGRQTADYTNVSMNLGALFSF